MPERLPHQGFKYPSRVAVRMLNFQPLALCLQNFERDALSNRKKDVILSAGPRPHIGNVGSDRQSLRPGRVAEKQQPENNDTDSDFDSHLKPQQTSTLIYNKGQAPGNRGVV